MVQHMGPSFSCLTGMMQLEWIHTSQHSHGTWACWWPDAASQF